jgi:hypothetical protein
MASEDTASGRRSRSKGAAKGAVPESKKVLAWAEVGVTICIDPENRQYVRASFGHERYADNDSRAALLRAADELDEINEEILEKIVRKYGKLAREYQQSIVDDADEDDDSPTARARRKLKKRNR